MDWNLKTPSWDLTEFGQEPIPNVNTFCGSSSFGGQGIKGDFSVDLKLGQVVNSSIKLSDNFKVPSVPQMVISPSGSSKRARSTSNGLQMASCLVDGCNADLSKCREYHRRHKVCELHSKTPQVTISGHKQRFCQQCSRFHSLEEFDEVKRSCRKRLDGHNRRRRKPQPGPLSRVGNFMTTCQGARLLSFSSSQVYPTTAAASPIWAGVAKAVEDAKLYNKSSQLCFPDKQNLFLGSSSSSKFSFLHGTSLALGNETPSSESSICQPYLKTVSSSESEDGDHKMFCYGLSNQAVHSECALSLLSSSRSQPSGGINLSHLMQPNSVPMAHFNSMEAIDSILVPNANVHGQGMFHRGPDPSSDNETPQTLPFYWE